MVKTIIMTSVRAIGPGAGPSMLNIGAADIVRGHMVVHDLGAGSECVGGPLAAALSRSNFGRILTTDLPPPGYARAMSGQAAVPPTSVTKSRLLTQWWPLVPPFSKVAARG
jgi:hypothetical protein